jgi:hypothetical protein
MLGYENIVPTMYSDGKNSPTNCSIPSIGRHAKSWDPKSHLTAQLEHQTMLEIFKQTTSQNA